jgi:hypothetical protein
VAVTSPAYWASQFGRDPDALSQTTAINGQPITIVGVGPEGHLCLRGVAAASRRPAAESAIN